LPHHLALIFLLETGVADHGGCSDLIDDHPELVYEGPGVFVHGEAHQDVVLLPVEPRLLQLRKHQLVDLLFILLFEELLEVGD